MICIPFQGARKENITQYFGQNPQWYDGKGHPGLDWAKSYGTPLVAPQDGEVYNIITPNNFSESQEPLRRGFGIYIQGIDGYLHMYWHCLPIFPVAIGQKVEKGKTIIAFMGNSGYVLQGGSYMDINFRNNPPYFGTHLHQEIIGSNNKKIDPISFIDWDYPISYQPIGLITSIRISLNKIQSLITKGYY